MQTPAFTLYNRNQFSLVGRDNGGIRCGPGIVAPKLVIGEVQDSNGTHKLALPLEVLSKGGSKQLVSNGDYSSLDAQLFQPIRGLNIQA